LAGAAATVVRSGAEGESHSARPEYQANPAVMTQKNSPTATTSRSVMVPMPMRAS